MCPFAGAKFGDTIQDIIDACNDTEHEAVALTDAQIAAFNGTCDTLFGLNLGDKLAAMIEAVNNQDPTIHVRSISAPETVTVAASGSTSITVEVTPSNASDKTFSIAVSPDDVISAEIDGSNVNISGLTAGEATITITPTDTTASAVECVVTVTE